MKTFLIALSILAFVGCNGTAPPAVVVPSDADLKADVMLQGSGPSRTIKITFYFSKPVPFGEKSAPDLDVIQVEEARFNDTVLAMETNDAGRPVYSAENIAIKPDNLVSIVLNGKHYEAKAMTQTTLSNRSATIVMIAK